MVEKEFRHIVRIVNTDIGGNKSVYIGLTKIKGIGHMFSNMVLNYLDIDKSLKIGDLTDEQVSKIDEAVKNLESINAPAWMYNRKKDPETGKDVHLVASDIKFIKDNDIKLQRKIKSYIGSRHSAGLPVRGQKTKNNFRKNKGKATGVKRKK
mgnify:CR=1 FL=1|tara:strand:- start:315 stop:770 length:456 start_codon:yes stop_codon:yes gene_type:complete